MAIIIRKASEKDMPAVLDLIKELALFERELKEVEIDIKTLSEDGFGSSPAFHCLVAEEEGHILGMALVYPRYSTWKGRALHLEDLIVKEDARGKGIGTKLLDAVVRYAYETGVKRISWEVLDWNEQAIDFYEKKGAKILRDWDVCQMNEEAIKSYIDKLN